MNKYMNFKVYKIFIDLNKLFANYSLHLIISGQMMETSLVLSSMGYRLHIVYSTIGESLASKLATCTNFQSDVAS